MGGQTLSSIEKGVNFHVSEFLSYYLAESRNLNYAVALSGAWGSGKTHFVRTFFEQEKSAPHIDYFYVSLFGLKSTDQIQEDLGLQALAREDTQEEDPGSKFNPLKRGRRLLNNKKKLIRRLGDAVGGVLPAVGSGLSTLLRMHTIPNDIVIVLDDVERAEIPPVEVLAFVNHFVEHQGNKVILLINEDELKNGGELEYNRQKEKVVGKVLKITPDVDVAIDQFILEFEVESFARIFFSDKRESIIQIYKSSEIQNLRILQQSLWLFERFLTKSPTALLDNLPALDRVFKLLLALNLEFSGNKINEDAFDCRASSDHPLQRIRRDQSDLEKILNDRNQCYSVIDLRDPVLSNETIRQIIDDGYLDAVAIERDIAYSGLLNSESEPAWRTLIHWGLRTDLEVNRAIERIEKRIALYACTDFVELLQTVGIRTWLANACLIDKSHEQLSSEHKACVDALAKTGCFEREPFFGDISKLNDLLSDQQLFVGPGLHELTNSHRRALGSYAEGYFTSAKQAVLQKAADNFLVSVSSLGLSTEKIDLSVIRGMIKDTKDEFIHLLDPVEFCKTLVLLSPQARRELLLLIQNRIFEFEDTSSSREAAWVSTVRDGLKGLMQSDPLSRARFLWLDEIVFRPLTSE